MNKVEGFEVRLEREMSRAGVFALALDVLCFTYCIFALQRVFSEFIAFDILNPIIFWVGSFCILFRTGLSVLYSKTHARKFLGWFLICRVNDFLKNQKIASDWIWKSIAAFQLVFTLALTFFLGYELTQIDFYILFDMDGFQGVRRIFGAFLSPNLEILPMVLSSMVETIFIAFMATAFALPLAFLMSFFCARNLAFESNKLWPRMLYTVLRFVANFSRSIEPLIWAIIFSVWVGIGPFAGMLALSIHSLAALVKLYSEQVESINQGPVEAIKATGAHPILVIWYAVVPQIVLPYLSFTIYRWDINIRMATVIGLVGGGGIGTLLIQYQGLAKWNEVGTIIIVIAAVVWIMDYLSARIRQAIY